nr:hypothetical protein [Borrelia turcica]
MALSATAPAKISSSSSFSVVLPTIALMSLSSVLLTPSAAPAAYPPARATALVVASSAIAFSSVW